MQRIFGLAVHNIHDEYNVELIRGVQKFCKDYNHQLFIFPINAKHADKYGYEYRYGGIKGLISANNLDGLILSSASLSSFIDEKDFLNCISQLEPLPTVHIGMALPGKNCVTSDSEDAFKRMISHLIEKHNKTNFILLTSHDTNVDSRNRTKWFLDVLENHNIKIDKSHMLNCDFNKNSAKMNIKEYVMNNGVDFDCVVSLNDSMAIGAIKGLEDCSVRIPEDVTITGFDNYKGATYSLPTLTTINPQLNEQGYQAALLLHNYLNGEKTPVHKKIDSVEIFRSSCGCLSKDKYLVDYIDKNGNEVNFSLNEITQIIHNNPGNINTELYSLHQLAQSSMTVVNLTKLFDLLPDYIERISLKGMAIFIYDRPKKYAPNTEEFKIPEKATRIFSYELGTRKANIVPQETNPVKDMIPAGTFNTEFDSLVVYPLFETQLQYGYILVPLTENDLLYYEVVLELFSKEITSAIRLDNEEKENLKLESSNSKLKKYSSELSILSTTDELTKIYNRRGFMNAAQKAIKDTIAKNKSGMIIFCDMDGMKLINDTYGHDAGDRAIQAEAEVLQRACRNTDIIGRLGGDEFAVYVEEMDRLGFERFKNRIKNETTFINNRNLEKFNISMSLGCTEVNEDCNIISKLLIKADKELYIAKKNRIMQIHDSKPLD